MPTRVKRVAAFVSILFLLTVAAFPLVALAATTSSASSSSTTTTQTSSSDLLAAAYNSTTTVQCTQVTVGESSICSVSVDAVGYPGFFVLGDYPYPYTGERVSFSVVSGGVTLPSPPTCSLGVTNTQGTPNSNCSISVMGAAAGPAQVMASYPGDSNNGASSGTTSFTVEPAATSTTATTSPTPEFPGSYMLALALVVPVFAVAILSKRKPL